MNRKCQTFYFLKIRVDKSCLVQVYQKKKRTVISKNVFSYIVLKVIHRQKNENIAFEDLYT